MDRECMFSLLTVCYNPGEKLRRTVESALRQTYTDFELIIKDGVSKDGSLESISDLLADPRIHVYSERDKGIYDAMNRAVELATGKYVFFLNCGDLLYDEGVLARVAAEEERVRCKEPGAEEKPSSKERWIIYGNVFSRKTKAWITPPPAISGFTCYRNIPCHQACFYDTGLCKEKPFETKYKIRGDYEHFLWCFYRGKARMHYLDTPIAEYEGGGYSETKENLKRSKREHKEIVERYMKRGELLKYRALLAITLAPLRTYLAESPRFSGAYFKLLKLFYGKGQR